MLDNEDFKTHAAGRGKGTAKDMDRFGISLEHVTCYILGAYRALVFSCGITERRC
jgi:hypothetical protein